MPKAKITPSGVPLLRILLRGLKIGFSMPYLVDFFQNAVIDAGTWDQTVVATGTITRTLAGGYIYVALAGAAAADEAVLETDGQWQVRPGSFDDDEDVINEFDLEFMARFTDVGNIDNATTILGLVPAQGNDRASVDVIGFILTGDVLYTLTDAAGVETVTDVSAGLVIGNWNKYRIQVTAGSVKFYVNDVEVSDHVVNLPDDEMFLCFHEQSDGAGGAIDVAEIRCWYLEDWQA